MNDGVVVCSMCKLIVEKIPFDLCEELDKFNLRLTVNTGVLETLHYCQCPILSYYKNFSYPTLIDSKISTEPLNNAQWNSF
jgi:hypothetical protein